MAENQPAQSLHPATDMDEAMDHVRQHSGSPPRKVSNQEMRQAIFGASAAGRFNDRLAALITKGVGTMWAAYIFAAIALVSFPEALRAFQQGNMVVAVGWLSTSFLQLVLLPIIIVGQNLISTHQSARAETDHETLTTLYSINVHQLEILEKQQRIINALDKQRGQTSA